MLASGRLLCLVCELALRIATRFLRFFGKVPKRLKSDWNGEQECHAFRSLMKKEQTRNLKPRATNTDQIHATTHRAASCDNDVDA